MILPAILQAVLALRGRRDPATPTGRDRLPASIGVRIDDAGDKPCPPAASWLVALVGVSLAFGAAAAHAATPESNALISGGILSALLWFVVLVTAAVTFFGVLGVLPIVLLAVVGVVIMKTSMDVGMNDGGPFGWASPVDPTGGNLVQILAGAILVFILALAVGAATRAQAPKRHPPAPPAPPLGARKVIASSCRYCDKPVDKCGCGASK